MKRKNPNFNQLLKNYINNREHHKREIGRYWSSDLYGILTGKFLPQDFFEGKKPLDLQSCKNIAEGELREEGLKWILEANNVEFKYQPKIEYKVEDFVLVVVADFLMPDYVLECKSPTYMSGIKDYHKPQLEAQYRVFNKPVYVGYLKERWENKFYLYKPSDQLWEEILDKLKEFHKEVKRYEKSQG